MDMPGLLCAITEEPGMFFLWDARNSSGLSFALTNNDNPRDVSHPAEFWVRPCFCISWQISCSCLMVQDFVEVAPRREFTTWDAQPPFENVHPGALSISRSVELGSIPAVRNQQPSPRGMSLKIKQIPAQPWGSWDFKPKLILGVRWVSLASLLTPGTEHQPPAPAPRISPLFPPLEQQPMSYFGEEKPDLQQGWSLPGSATSACAPEGRACVTPLPHRGQNLNNLDSCPSSPGLGSSIAGNGAFGMFMSGTRRMS